ncbi:hypothetical protein [Baaleninema simplex]|uniref:hypothetical protein n=1 Tax=Baaleninema simplex TaxID=2862350 RepID=UPI00034C5AC9|nr:hypothetical protein [Baaleninema simplex]
MSATVAGGRDRKTQPIQYSGILFQQIQGDFRKFSNLAIEGFRLASRSLYHASDS